LPALLCKEIFNVVVSIFKSEDTGFRKRYFGGGAASPITKRKSSSVGVYARLENRGEQISAAPTRTPMSGRRPRAETHLIARSKHQPASLLIQFLDGIANCSSERALRLRLSYLVYLGANMWNPLIPALDGRLPEIIHANGTASRCRRSSMKMAFHSIRISVR
jgi:hypothetical protein